MKNKIINIIKNNLDQKNRLNTFILVAIISLAVLMRFSFFEHGLGPDEALYAGGAYSLYSKGELTFNDKPWRFHPPLVLFIISIGYFILGPQDLTAKVIFPFFGVLSVLATYFLGKTLYNRRVGLMAALFITINPIHWYVSERIRLDGPLMLFFVLTTIFFYKALKKDNIKYSILFGISAGLLGLTKSTGVLIYTIIFTFLIINERNLKKILKKKMLLGILLSLIIQIPWYVRNIIVLGNIGWYQPSIVFGGGHFYYFNNLPFLLTKPMLIAFIVGLFLIFKNGVRKLKTSDILTINIIVVFLVAISSWPEKVPRYFVPVLPFFTLISSRGIDRISKILYKKESRKVFFILLILFSISIIHTDTLKFKQFLFRNSYAYRGIDEAGVWLKINAERDSLILSGSCRGIHYYSQRKCNYIGGMKDVNLFFELVKKNTKPTYLVIDRWERLQPQWIYPLTENKLTFLMNNGFNIVKIISISLPVSDTNVQNTTVAFILKYDEPIIK